MLTLSNSFKSTADLKGKQAGLLGTLYDLIAALTALRTSSRIVDLKSLHVTERNMKQK